MVDQAKKKYFEARSKLLLEAVISTFLDTHTPHEVARILREQAEILIRYI